MAAATLAVGGTAVAQDRAARPERAERMADMTRAQAEARAATAFARMDANSDGTLNAADREARARARFAEMDTSGDGLLSFEEMQAHRSEAREDRAERMGERRMRRGARGGAHHAMMGGRMGENASMTSAQFTAAALARFDAADANNDGTVTAAERRAQMQERRGQRVQRSGQ
ncbi:hypothetical protein AAW00_07920 [Aurantiacibacter luteus]|uniref:EF-hand domain-containing protein n=1 Tax=Aurantiacibacter luteus TaxID=1581420 RepID=A0A0G9MVU8_9SPHN|nr:hypothetical protein AAW00_07920 [Aurantiacibacter luteus]